MAKIPKKLFDLASEATRRRAQRIFAGTPLGRALRKVEQMKARTGSMLQSVVVRLRRQHTQSLIKRLTSSSTPRESYAANKKPSRNVLLRGLFKALGPVGNIFKALMFPVKQAAVALERQIKAASNLLKAFGYAVIPPPSEKKPLAMNDQEAMAEALKAAGWDVKRPGERDAEPQRQPAKAPAPAPRSQDPNRRPGRVRIGNRWVSDRDPLVTGEMIRVSSSNVHSIGFDANPGGAPVGTLKVTFREHIPNTGPGRPKSNSNNPGSTYFYKGVPVEVFIAFQQASSKGRFVWDRLRIRGTVSGHQYDYELGGISQGYVPRKATFEGDSEWYRSRTFATKEGYVFRSQLPDSVARDVNRGEPNRGNRGRPNRGEPNTGAPDRG